MDLLFTDRLSFDRETAWTEREREGEGRGENKKRISNDAHKCDSRADGNR